MIKKTFKYEDFNGKERSEDVYFHLTNKEIAEWLTTEGDYTLDARIARVVQENNGKVIMKLFDDLILRSVGVMSLDGRRFDKNDKIREDFKATPMYSDLFMELMGDSEKAIEFLRGILPKDLQEGVLKIMAENGENFPKIG